MSDPAATRARTRSGYDAVAVEYTARLRDELAGKPLDRALLGAVGAAVVAAGGGPVLDVGSGPGQVGAAIAAGAGAGIPVVGVDLSERMCRIAADALDGALTADMTRLPIGTAAIAGVVCFYAVIHLDPAGRERAYREFARVLRPGGELLLAFHIRSPAVAMGEMVRLRELMGSAVDIDFHFLDPDVELSALQAAGFRLVARAERAPDPRVEHPSDRGYLWVRRPDDDERPGGSGT